MNLVDIYKEQELTREQILQKAIDDFVNMNTEIMNQLTEAAAGLFNEWIKNIGSVYSLRRIGKHHTGHKTRPIEERHCKKKRKK